MTPQDPPGEQLTPGEFLAIAGARRRLHRDHLRRVAGAYARGEWAPGDEPGILLALLRAVEEALLEAADDATSRGITLDSEVITWTRRARQR